MKTYQQKQLDILHAAANVCDKAAKAAKCEGTSTAAYNYIKDRLEHLESESVKRQSYSIEHLESDLADEIRDCFIGILESSDIQDRLHEMSDNSVPIYNWDLAQYLANDLGLAWADDDCLAPDADIFARLQWSIYERLQSAASEAIQSLIDEKQDHFEYMQNKWEGYSYLLFDIMESDIDGDAWTRLDKKHDIAIEKGCYFADLVSACEEY